MRIKNNIVIIYSKHLNTFFLYRSRLFENLNECMHICIARIGVLTLLHYIEYYINKSLRTNIIFIVRGLKRYFLKCYYIFSALAEILLFTVLVFVTTLIIIIVIIILVYTDIAEKSVFLTRTANTR